MSEPARRVLVLDMGNVLLSLDGEAILRGQGVDDPEDIRVFLQTVLGSSVWHAYDRGTADKTAFLPVIEQLPAHLRAKAREMVIEKCFALEYMDRIPQTLDLAERALAAGYPVYLLSNAGQDFYIYRRKLPELADFSGLFISSDWRLLKPEPEIFRTFLAHFGLRAGDCVFVDDVPANIAGAKDAGMDGICFNATREPIERLYAQLKEKGIVLC